MVLRHLGLHSVCSCSSLAVVVVPGFECAHLQVLPDERGLARDVVVLLSALVSAGAINIIIIVWLDEIYLSGVGLPTEYEIRSMDVDRWEVVVGVTGEIHLLLFFGFQVGLAFELAEASHVLDDFGDVELFVHLL